MSQPDAPTVSVVTINFNNAAGLARTLASVEAQHCARIEHIVIDGGSTDGSPAILEASSFPRRWISERDRGVYHAMNKGLALAGGEYVLFLNSGDHFIEPSVLTTAIAEIGCCDIHYFSIEVRSPVAGGADRAFIKSYPKSLRFSYFLNDSLPHPASFIRRSLLLRHRGYDESLRICADWKQFMVAICRDNCSYRYHAETLSTFYLDGLSSRPENRRELLAERRRVLEAEFPAFVADIDAQQALASAHAALSRHPLFRIGRKIGLVSRRHNYSAHAASSEKAEQ